MENQSRPLTSLTKFGQKAVEAYHNRKYVGAIISGDFGKGKSMSALHMAREITQHIRGVDRMTAFREVLQNTLFTMDEVIAATDLLKTKEYWIDLTPQEVVKRKQELRKPVLIWDDAGMHGSKYKHFIDMSDAYDLQSNFDTIRDVTACMIMTVPEDDELLKFLRNYRGNYMVDILRSGGGLYNRKLQFWKYGKDRIGRKRLFRKWTSAPFSIYVEKEIYGEYERKKTIAKLENTERYRKKKEMREAKAKYYETKQLYYQKKMERELQELSAQ